MKSVSPMMRSAVLCLLAPLLAASPIAHAEYPERTIRFIVPAAPGGAADLTARILTASLSQRLGQPIVIENKPGASGAIALSELARAPADGYTIGGANLATFVVAALAAQSLPYDPTKDFTPIAMQMTAPNLLAVTPSLPAHSVNELVTYAKAHPNKVFYGSTGYGTALHVVTELFRTTANIQIEHVPYKSAPAAESDLASGQIQMMIGNFTSMLPQIKASRLRALAITGPARSALLPDVPTIAEAGFPIVEMETWSGVVGPGAMPASIVEKLNAEINAVLSDPRVVQQHIELGVAAAPGSSRQFAERIQADRAKWGKVIKDNAIVLN